MKTPLQVGIVGTGPLARSLAFALTSSRHHIHTVMSRSRKKAIDTAREMGAEHGIQLLDPIPEGVNTLFICVPDDSISNVAQSISTLPYPWPGVLAIHTSGALSSSVLSPLKQVGAHTMSFHPVQTFSKGAITSFAHIYIGIEGDDTGTETGKILAEDLGATPLVLSSTEKVIYHAASVFASNFLVVATSIACDLLESINMDRESAHALLAPLIEQTCKNLVNNMPENVLTGPAARGDLKTIEQHTHSIRQDVPDFRSIYLHLTREAIHIASKSNRIPPDKHQILQAKLDSLSI